MHRVGRADGVGRRDQSPRRGLEGAPAVPRIGSRAGHRLQRARAAGRACRISSCADRTRCTSTRLGAQRIPDPTTAGDFCRRFGDADLEALQAAINETRTRVWRAQPAAFFDDAIIDADGTLAETTGQCKEGMDIAYNGVWGYHPLVLSLAQTQEPLFLENRSGNRPVGRRRGGPLRSGGRAVSRRGLPADHVPRRHGFHADDRIGSLGRGRHPVCVWRRRARQRRQTRRRPAEDGVAAAGAPAPVRRGDRATRAPGRM